MPRGTRESVVMWLTCAVCLFIVWSAVALFVLAARGYDTSEGIKLLFVLIGQVAAGILGWVAGTSRNNDNH